MNRARRRRGQVAARFAVAPDELARGDLHARRRQPTGDQREVVEDHLPDRAQSLGRCARPVGGQDDVLQIARAVPGRHRLLRPDVDRGPQLAGGDPVEDRVEVEHRGSADEHEPGTRGERRDALAVEQAATLLGDGREHEYDIAAREQLVEGGRDPAGLADDGVGQPWIVDEDRRRGEAAEQAVQRAPEVAVADQTDPGRAQVDGILGGGAEIAFLAATKRAILAADSPAQVDREPERVLGSEAMFCSPMRMVRQPFPEPTSLRRWSTRSSLTRTRGARFSVAY